MADMPAPYDAPGTPGTPAPLDGLETRDRIFLEKLQLATGVLLQAGEDPDTLNNVFQTELFLFRDRIDRALLLLPEPTTA